MSDHDPHEILEEILSKKDNLDPFKAIEKVKGFMIVVMFFIGLAPLLFNNLIKLAPVFLIIVGLLVVPRLVRMAWQRSRRL